MKTLNDLKIELNESSLYVDYDEPDYDNKDYPIYFISKDKNGEIREFSEFVMTFSNEIKPA